MDDVSNDGETVLHKYESYADILLISFIMYSAVGFAARLGRRFCCDYNAMYDCSFSSKLYVFKRTLSMYHDKIMRQYLKFPE